MRIVIPGGSGHLGQLLAGAFHDRGDEVVIVTRHPVPARHRMVDWSELANVIDDADVVINLAGRSVLCRYRDKNRRAIMSSRVDTTRAVAEAIAKAENPPRVWLQASTATIYDHRFDDANDEHHGHIAVNGNGRPEWHFSIEVATAWEKIVDEAQTPRTRKVKMRSAIVMSNHRGGPFDILRRLTLAKLGGQAGDGQQYVSWVHQHDFVRAIEWLIDRDDLDGAINIASPNPLPNVELMREIRRACGVHLGIPASAWMIDAASFVMRVESELVLKSRRVVPARLLESGFAFDFPRWPKAARDLCTPNGGRW
jgi:uncharacterized protein (TIGR01777 family)